MNHEYQYLKYIYIDNPEKDNQVGTIAIIGRGSLTKRL